MKAKRRTKSRNPSLAARVVKLYNSGLPARTLATVVACHEQTVRKILRLDGVKIKRGRPLGSFKVPRGERVTRATQELVSGSRATR